MSCSRASAVSRLRRAFLLRAHPDRFARFDNSVRRSQANLVQALSARLSSPDFAAYSRPDNASSGGGGGDGSSWRSNRGSGDGGGEGAYKGLYGFVLERKDGSLLRRTINLDDTVEQVLRSIADALLSSGASKSSIPDVPPPPRPSSNGGAAGGQGTSSAWAWAPPSSSDATHSDIDHRFDVNTRLGRNLLHFLRSPSAASTLIDERRSRRLDAHSAALAVRRAYGFLSVDGTSIGWSSESLAACLGRLMDLKEEYGDTALRVDSFYPLRLVIGYEDGYSDVLDDFRDSLKRGDNRNLSEEEEEITSRSVDLYAGTVTLGPSSTSLQWLKALRSVTAESIEIYKTNGERLRRYSRVVKDVLNVKVRRGLTCSPREYHDFMFRFAAALDPDLAFENGGSNEAGTASALAITSSGLSPDEVTHLTVESDATCRRGIVTSEGTVRVGVAMSAQAVVKSLSRLGERARNRAVVRAEAEGRCRDAINLTKAELGLTNVYRVALGAVTADQAVECLHRLLGRVRGDRSDMLDEEGEEMRYRLAGNSLGVTGTGRFCQLSDDGSFVIPIDFS